MRPAGFLTRFKPDYFFVGLFAAVVLAILFPSVGARDGILHPELTNKIGVALIFFIHGVGTSFSALKAGTLHWRLHLLVQTCTFGLFPLLGLAIYHGGKPWMGSELALGLFFLTALPSTVSSSVALTAAARGNVAAALFNATISSLLGVILTPLWIGAVLAAEGTPPDYGAVVLDLCKWLVLPLLLGQLARPLLASTVQRHKSRISFVDRWTILFLVYTSFCDSVLAGVWQSHGIGTLSTVLVAGSALFAIVMIVSNLLARTWGFPVEDRIAVMFCGSKKSMATGLPMAQLIFGHSPVLGIVVLPLLVYHTLQLVAAGVLASRWGSRSG